MKLVTWNTQWCRGVDGVVSPERIVAVSRELGDFDVLCLQEIAVGYPGLPGNSGQDQPAVLGALLPGYQLFFAAAVDEWNARGERSRFGNLIATRLPAGQLQQHALPYPADPTVCHMPRVCLALTVQDPVLGPVRVMTTHLEYYSASQRLAQAQALRALHIEACGQAAAPGRAGKPESPLQPKPHTGQAIVCGDFNFGPAGPEYAALRRPFAVPGTGGRQRLWDCWTLLRGRTPHQPTFRLHDRQHGPDPVACDFVFVSEALKERVADLKIDAATQASDHQPVAVELA